MTDESQIQQPGASPDTPSPSGDNSAMADNDAMRKLIMQVGQLAQRNPQAKGELEAAAKALTAASLKLVAGQQPQEQSQPIIGS